MSTNISDKMVKKQLLKQFKKVSKEYAQYRNNPYFSGYIHQFRINTRKLRAQLNFIKNLIPLEEYKTLNENLKYLAQQVGNIREIDVLIETITQLALDEPNLIDIYVDIFRFLEEEKLEAIEKQATLENFNDMETRLSHIKKSLESLELKIVDNQSLEDFFNERFNHKINNLKNEWTELKDDYEQIHTVRKNAKKLRYSAESFGKWTNKKVIKKIGKQTRTIQKQLGYITDYYVNIQFIQDYKDKTNHPALEEAFNIIIKHMEKNKASLNTENLNM